MYKIRLQYVFQCIVYFMFYYITVLCMIILFFVLYTVLFHIFEYIIYIILYYILATCTIVYHILNILCNIYIVYVLKLSYQSLFFWSWCHEYIMSRDRWNIYVESMFWIFVSPSEVLPAEIYPGFLPTICFILRRTRNSATWKVQVWYMIWYTPHPVTVTTRIITFLVGNPYKPSFATVTGWGVDPRYMIWYTPKKNIFKDILHMFLV